MRVAADPAVVPRLACPGHDRGLVVVQVLAQAQRVERLVQVQAQRLIAVVQLHGARAAGAPPPGGQDPAPLGKTRVHRREDVGGQPPLLGAEDRPPVAHGREARQLPEGTPVEREVVRGEGAGQVGEEPAQRGQLLFQVQRVEDLRLDHLAGFPVDQVQPAKRRSDREIIRPERLAPAAVLAERQDAGQVSRDAPDVLAADEQRRHRQLHGPCAVVDGRSVTVNMVEIRSGRERGEAAGEGAGGAGRGDVQRVPARVQVSRARGLHARGDLHVRGDEPGVEQATRHRVDQLVGQRHFALARDQLGEVRVPTGVPLGRQRQDAGGVSGRVPQADPRGRSRRAAARGSRSRSGRRTCGGSPPRPGSPPGSG